MSKTLGILGGMGPLASCDLLRKVIENTDAHSDGEHLHVILDSNTAIPDRTAAILRGGADPRPEMIASARRLTEAGAEVLVMACNTAHFFYDDVAAAVEVPILHMPRLTAEAVRAAGLGPVALLATDGTVQSGIYQAAFSGGEELLLPDEAGQRAVMELIYDGVKAGRTDFPTGAIRGALDRLAAAGARALILGCTELPLAFPMYGLPGRTVDPTRILARAAVRACGAPLTEETDR